MKEINKNINSITALRFFAAFLVVGFHFFSFGQDLSFFNEIFAKGHLGIEFFFVLSGFVIGLRYLPKDEIHIKEFYKKRLIRISPSYYLALILSIPLMIKSIQNLESTKIFLLTTSTIFYLQSFIPIDFLSKHWNHPAWSVSTEIFFYLLFPVLGFKHIKKYQSEKSFLITITLIILVWIANQNVKFENIIFINIPIFRYLEFIFGAILAKMFLEKKLPFLANKLAVTILLLCTALVFTLEIPVIIYSDASPMMISLFGFLIFSIASFEVNNDFKMPKVFITLGEASYSIYILQVPLKFFFQQFYSKILNLNSKGSEYSITLGLFIVILCVIINRYFEEKLIKKLNFLSSNETKRN